MLFPCLYLQQPVHKSLPMPPQLLHNRPRRRSPQRAASNKPVVRVNGSVLTDIDLTREEYAIFPYARQHGGLPKDLAPQIRDGALKMIIFEELVYQEALRRNMTVPAAKMQRAETDFRKQFSTPEQFDALLQSEFHGSQKLLGEKIRRSLLIDALLKTEVENKSVVSAAEVRAFYDKNPARFRTSGVIYVPNHFYSSSGQCHTRPVEGGARACHKCASPSESDEDGGGVWIARGEDFR